VESKFKRGPRNNNFFNQAQTKEVVEGPKDKRFERSSDLDEESKVERSPDRNDASDIPITIYEGKKIAPY